MPNSRRRSWARGYSGEARGRAIGIWASVSAMMSAVGPVVGGWLIDIVGWRAIFLINLPLAAGAVLLALRYVRDSRDRDRPALDGPGGLLATVALGALTWGLTIGSGHTGWTGWAIGCVVLGVGLALAFVAIEKRRGERAMMPLDMFGSSSFIGLTILTLMLYGALGALLVLVPYLLIETSGYSGVEAGSALVPAALMLTFASPLMGRVAGRIGPRLPLTVGPLVVGVGFLLALRIGPQADYWTEVLPAILVISLGMVGAVAPLTNRAGRGGCAPYRIGFRLQQRHGARRRPGRDRASGRRVLGTKGAALIQGFHIAAAACAVACLAPQPPAPFFLITPPVRK